LCARACTRSRRCINTTSHAHDNRLLRAWSFQSKLGIICQTLMLAAGQLAHLLLVIVVAITLFAQLSYLALGQRVSYASSYSAAFEETFSALLGLGYIKLPHVFPPAVTQSRPQLLLSVVVYYGREALFVMVLMQFFMTTLGGVFMQLKAAAAGGRSTSIPQDLRKHVLPELRAKATGLVRCLRRQGMGAGGLLWQAGGPRGRAAAAAPGSSNAQAGAEPALLLQSRSSEALRSFLKARLPHLVTRKAFGDRVPAIRLGGAYVDLPSLQQLCAEMALQQGQAEVLLRTAPARAYARRAASARAGQGAAAAGLPDAGRNAAMAGAPPGAVAAAMAAAQQLMGICGGPVDAARVRDNSLLQLQLLGGLSLEDLAQDGDCAEGLLPGRDYTAEVRGRPHDDQAARGSAWLPRERPRRPAADPSTPPRALPCLCLPPVTGPTGAAGPRAAAAPPDLHRHLGSSGGHGALEQRRGALAGQGRARHERLAAAQRSAARAHAAPPRNHVCARACAAGA
jgi:hypothetical protein